jgi:hypothetical protein
MYFRLNTFEILFFPIISFLYTERLKEVQNFFKSQIEANSSLVDTSKRPYQAFVYYQALKEISPMNLIFLTRDLMGLTWSKMKRNESSFIKSLVSSIVVRLKMNLVKSLLTSDGAHVHVLSYKDICELNIEIPIFRSSACEAPHPLGGSPTRAIFGEKDLKFDQTSQMNLSKGQYKIAEFFNRLLCFE